MKKNLVFKNAAMAVLQVTVFGVILFFLYRYLLQKIGAEKLGVWSLVLASTSVTRVANLGLSGSVVKFVAKYSARNDLQSVSRVIQTTFITVGLLVGVVLLVIYPLAPNVLAFALEPSAMLDALSILPYAFLSVWFSMLYMVYMGALDGLQRIDIRSAIMMAGALLQAVLAVILVRKLGLVGLALSQVIQYVVLLLVSFLVLRRFIHLPLIPYQWDRVLFREMLGYGVNFQIISITVMLYDPVTKGLLARFGGLAMVGYYEMANRLVVQIRGLITAANQVLVPTIADLKERASEDIRRVYSNSVRVIFFVAIPTFAALIVAAPAISVAWLGNREPIFIVAIYVLAIGWAANTLSGPAYFAYLGIGTLRWNTVAHVLIGVLNVVLGLFLSVLLGGMGAILGWMAALICGSLLLIVVYSIEQSGSWGVYLTRPNFLLLVGAVLSTVLATLVFRYIPVSSSWFSHFVAAITCFVGCISIPVWQHPVRRQLLGLFAIYLSRGPQDII